MLMIPKFKKDLVYEKLQSAIRSGVYAPGTKLPKELDFARELGVSFITLRAALGRLEEDGLIVRIPSKGTFVSESPAELREKSADGRILMAFPDFGGDPAAENLFNRNLILGAVKQGYLSGYEILACLPESVDALLAEGAAGVIWDRPLPSEYGRISALARRGMPQVTVNRHIEGIPAVGCNYPSAIRQAVRQLRSIGHKYIALIDHAPERAAVFAERQNAFFEQLRYGGVEETGRFLIPIRGGGNTVLRIADGMRRIPEATAAIVSVVFMDAFHTYVMEERIGVPGELSVIQWGEDLRFGLHADHPYSILTEPRSAVGQCAVRLICDHCHGKPVNDSVRLFDAELLMRTGCALPRTWKMSAGL